MRNHIKIFLEKLTEKPHMYWPEKKPKAYCQKTLEVLA